MIRKIFSFICVLFFTSFLFCESQKINFIKGDISQKTVAVREATGDEGIWLSKEALKFSIENKAILGNDRDLDGLAVAAILTLPVDYTKNSTENEKNILVNQFIQLFNDFASSNTVQIAVLTKLVQCKDYLPTKEFTRLLNNYIKDININTADSGVIKSVLTTLEFIGNNESFVTLYGFSGNSKYNNYKNEINSTISALIPNAMNEVLDLVHTTDIKQIKQIFSLVKENSKISKNFLSEIAENVLSQTILIVNNSSKISDQIIELQLDSINILSENKWTRASSVCITYFLIAQKEYEAKILSENDFALVISSLANVAPIDSVSQLTIYLEGLNDLLENGGSVPSAVVLAVINSLGAIGDKSAFDSLLAVTYLNYPEDVLSAARKALAGLRW